MATATIAGPTPAPTPPTMTTYIIDEIAESTSTLIFVSPTEVEEDDWIPRLPSYSVIPTDLFAKPTSTAAEKILDKDIDTPPPENRLAIVLGIAMPLACLAIGVFLWTWVVRDRVRKKRDEEREKGYERDAKRRSFYKSELDYALDSLADLTEPEKAHGTKSHPRGILKNRITPDLSPDDIYTLLPPKPKLRSGFSPKFSYTRYLDECSRWDKAKEAIEKAQADAKANAETVAKARAKEQQRKEFEECYKLKVPVLEAEEIIDDPEEEERIRKEKVERDREEAMRKLEQGMDMDRPSPTLDYINALDECEKGTWVGDNGYEFEQAHLDGEDYIKRHSWETEESSKKQGTPKRPVSGSRFIEEV